MKDSTLSWGTESLSSGRIAVTVVTHRFQLEKAYADLRSVRTALHESGHEVITTGIVLRHRSGTDMVQVVWTGLVSNPLRAAPLLDRLVLTYRNTDTEGIVIDG